MFAVVKIIEQEKSFWSKFKRPGITSERVNLPNGEYFFIITAEKKGDKVPFKEILDFSGNLRDSLLFENGFRFEKDWNYSPFKSDALSKKLLFDLAVSHLQKTQPNPINTKICICDNEGIYKKGLHRVVKFASGIHIVTKDRSLYEREIKKLLYEYGISVTASINFDASAKNCNVVISHFSRGIPLTFDGVIFTNEKRPFINARVFSVQNVDLSFEYEKLRPEGIDRFAFASALYEKCNVMF